MSTQLSMHGFKSIIARSIGTTGAPLKIDIQCYENIVPDEITIFTDDPRLTDLLVEAINGAVAAHKKEMLVSPPLVNAGEGEDVGAGA